MLLDFLSDLWLKFETHMFLQWSPYLHWCRCDAKARNSWRMCAPWTCWRPTEIMSKKPRQAQFFFKACNKLSSDHARLRRKSTFSAWDVMTPVTRWRIRPADFLFQVILFHVLHLVITSWFICQRLKTLLQVVKNFEVLKTWFEFFGRDTPYGNEIKACLVFSTLRLICWQQYIWFPNIRCFASAGSCAGTEWKPPGAGWWQKIWQEGQGYLNGVHSNIHSQFIQSQVFGFGNFWVIRWRPWRQHWTSEH